MKNNEKIEPFFGDIMVNNRPFKTWRQFHNAEKKTWLKHITKCPELLLWDCPSKAASEAANLMNDDFWTLLDRVPDYALDAMSIRHMPDVDPEKASKNIRWYHWAWGNLRIGDPVDGDDEKWNWEMDLAEKQDYKPRNKICKICGKWSFYDPERIPEIVLTHLQKEEWYYAKDGDKIYCEYTFHKFPFRDYCSDQCKRKGRNEQRRKIKPSRDCPYCHESYEGNARTCNKAQCKKRAVRDTKKKVISQSPSGVQQPT